MNKGLLSGFACTICWGFSTVLTKAALSRLDPLALLMLQLLSSISFLCFLQTVSGLKLNLWGKSAFKKSLPGILQPGLAYVLGFIGLKLTSASNEVIICSSEGILIVFFAWLFLHERISWQLCALSALGICGTFLAISPQSAIAANVMLGNILLLIDVVLAALYSVASHNQLEDDEPLYLLTLHQLSALVLVGSVLLASIFFGVMSRNQGTVYDYVLAIICGITQFALPFWLYLIAIKELGAARTSIFLALPAVFTLLGAYVFLGERLSLMQCFGAFIAVFAVGGLGVLRDG